MSNKSDLKPFSIFEAYDKVYFRLTYGVESAKENLQAIQNSNIDYKDLLVETWQNEIEKGYKRIYIGNLFFLDYIKLNKINSHDDFVKFDNSLYNLLTDVKLV